MAETVKQPESPPITIPSNVNFNPNEPVTIGYAHFDSFDSIEQFNPFIQHSPNKNTPSPNTQPETGITWFYHKLLDINNCIFKNGLQNGFYCGILTGIALSNQTDTTEIFFTGIQTGCFFSMLFAIQHAIPTLIPSVFASIYAKTLLNRYHKK